MNLNLSDSPGLFAVAMAAVLFAASFLGTFLGHHFSLRRRRPNDRDAIGDALGRQAYDQIELLASEEGQEQLDRLILVEAALLDHIEARITALAGMTDSELEIRMGFVPDRYAPSRREEIIDGAKRMLRGALPELKKKLVDLINDVVKTVVTGSPGKK